MIKLKGKVNKIFTIAINIDKNNKYKENLKIIN